jgi:hypothetical protein
MTIAEILRSEAEHFDPNAGGDAMRAGAAEIERLTHCLSEEQLKVSRLTELVGNVVGGSYAGQLAEGWDDLLEDMELRGMHGEDYYKASKARFAALSKNTVPPGFTEIDDVVAEYEARPGGKEAMDKARAEVRSALNGVGNATRRFKIDRDFYDLSAHPTGSEVLRACGKDGVSHRLYIKYRHNKHPWAIEPADLDAPVDLRSADIADIAFLTFPLTVTEGTELPSQGNARGCAWTSHTCFNKKCPVHYPEGNVERNAR